MRANIKIAIIDDEPKARGILRLLLAEFKPGFEITGEAGDVESGLKLIYQTRPDVVLLDVRMPDGTGFDLIGRLEPPHPKIIFVTAYDQYALQAIRLSAIDYILKPVIPTDLMSALEKAEELMDEESMESRIRTAIDNYKSPNSIGKIVLKTAESIIVVRIDEVVRCQSEANYTTFFLENGRSLVVSKPLKEYEVMLSPGGFLRVHQSHLINLQFFREFRKKDDLVVLTDGSEAPVASRKKDILLRAIDAMEHIP
ncbi:MAG: response regulator transcription factor [Bacteroidia bacterium]|nr:response regulator transcription factor [Bacteroidia bacterium]